MYMLHNISLFFHIWGFDFLFIYFLNLKWDVLRASLEGCGFTDAQGYT